MPPEPDEICSVTALTGRIKALIEGRIPAMWVEGEISGGRSAGRGHYYFTLKDDGAQLGATIWQSTVIKLKFGPRDGMKVFAFGRIEVYPPHGKYQFIVEKLEPQGIGAAELALRQLREKLFLQGYFDPNRKRPLPKFPRRIAIVTSPTGAAVRDMLTILSERWPCAEVILFPVQVQGASAAAEIASALGDVTTLHADGVLEFDAILLGRGGGSAEDLQAFNMEVVADAIFRSQVPVVSAVGHEIDTTIADNVADARAATPSHAVALVTSDLPEVLLKLSKLRRQFDEAIRNRLLFGKSALDAIAGRAAFRLPLERLKELDRRMSERRERLRRAIDTKRLQAIDRVAATAGRLESLSPLAVLSRGYSLTQTETGDIVRMASSVTIGQTLRTRVHSGEIVSVVTETSK